MSPADTKGGTRMPQFYRAQTDDCWIIAAFGDDRPLGYYETEAEASAAANFKQNDPTAEMAPAFRYEQDEATGDYIVICIEDNDRVTARYVGEHSARGDVTLYNMSAAERDDYTARWEAALADMTSRTPDWGTTHDIMPWTLNNDPANPRFALPEREYADPFIDSNDTEPDDGWNNDPAAPYPGDHDFRYGRPASTLAPLAEDNNLDDIPF